jgi:glycine oxidase
VNVVVVGAGVVGCAVGYELAARGARVRVLDMRDVGEGATRASAGVLCPHIEGHAPALLRLGVRSLAMYDEFVARTSRDAGMPIEYRRTGTLEVALTSAEAERLQATAAAHVRSGVEHRYLTPVDARELEPALSAQIAGALFVPVHGYVAVGRFTAALASAARARGATIDRGMSVRHVTQKGPIAHVGTPQESIEADAVVIAAGSWSGRFAAGQGYSPVKPIRGQLLHLGLPAPVASRVVWGAECYVVPWQDGSLLVGATVEDVGFDESATVAAVRDLADRACELLPSVWSARFHGVRVGLRPATSDELPIIGRSSQQSAVFYATGHYRNGVLLAPLTAVAIADLVLDRREAPELTITDPARFGL